MLTPQEIKLIAFSLVAACAFTCLGPARGDADASALQPALGGELYAGRAAEPSSGTLALSASDDDTLREALLLSSGAGWLMWPANKVMERALAGEEAPREKAPQGKVAQGKVAQARPTVQSQRSQADKPAA
ncbi:MAG TPA: hypothetical protein VGN52_13875 [Burkholderiales bacterium]|jgi:hypothetical protein